jgi:ankyrin repeat protein
LLIKAGCDVNAADDDGNMPLHAVVNGAGCTRASSISAADDEIANELVKLLIDKGADMHALNNRSKTPLQIAAECKSGAFFGHSRMLELLLKHAKPDAKEGGMLTTDAAGNTMLHLAAMGHSKVKFSYWRRTNADKASSNVQYLLEDKSIRPELVKQAGMQNVSGCTPLMALSKSNDSTSIFDSLLELSLEDPRAVNEQDDEGNTALHLVFQSRNTVS